MSIADIRRDFGEDAAVRVAVLLELAVRNARRQADEEYGAGYDAGLAEAQGAHAPEALRLHASLRDSGWTPPGTASDTAHCGCNRC